MAARLISDELIHTKYEAITLRLVLMMKNNVKQIDSSPNRCKETMLVHQTVVRAVIRNMNKHSKCFFNETLGLII